MLQKGCESRIPLSYGKSECQFFPVLSTEHRDIECGIPSNHIETASVPSCQPPDALHVRAADASPTAKLTPPPQLHSRVWPLWPDHEHITRLPSDAETRGKKKSPCHASKRVNGISPTQMFRTDGCLRGAFVLRGYLLPPLPAASNPTEHI